MLFEFIFLLFGDFSAPVTMFLTSLGGPCAEPDEVVFKLSPVLYDFIYDDMLNVSSLVTVSPDLFTIMRWCSKGFTS